MKKVSALERRAFHRVFGRIIIIIAVVLAALTLAVDNDFCVRLLLATLVDFTSRAYDDRDVRGSITRKSSSLSIGLLPQFLF